MIIDCISDLHGYYPKLKGGDLLIIAGDCTRTDHVVNDWGPFLDWVAAQKYRKKILVAGNHDNFCTHWAVSDDAIYEMYDGKPYFSYLCDSVTEFEGLKIWGSPYTTTFKGINPRCTAFTVESDEELNEHWKLIPEDTDILITHSPPYGLMDGIPLIDGSIFHVGSATLHSWLKNVGKPRLHVYGHIHEAYGREERLHISGEGVAISVNASHVDERYKPANKPIRIIL